MAEAHDAQAALAAERDPDFFPLNDLPNDLLVSVFAAAEDPTWVRRTFPLVCRAWNELYLSKDASPLHETLVVDFFDEVDRAKEERRRRVLFARPRTGAAAQALAAYRPVVHASRVISWAERRRGSVRKLRLVLMDPHDEGDASPGQGELKDFSLEDLAALIAVVAPSSTEIRFDFGLEGIELYEKQFWKSLRDSVVPAGRLRSLVVEGIGVEGIESDVGPLAQLAGSLQELVLRATGSDMESYGGSKSGLSRFPESLCALVELRRLKLLGHQQITAMPAAISSLKKLEELELVNCDLSSLPNELGELSALTRLDLSQNVFMGNTPQEEAFPAKLGRMKSLRVLDLGRCGLRAVPAFVGKLESLEELDLGGNRDLQIDAPLDFLVEGCPGLRKVCLTKEGDDEDFDEDFDEGFDEFLWTPESLAHLEAFKAKLRAKNPNARVDY